MVSSTPRPHFTPRKDPVPIVQEAGWAPGPVRTGRKSRSHRDSILDLQPVVSRYTDWAIWPTRHLQYQWRIRCEMVGRLAIAALQKLNRLPVIGISHSSFQTVNQRHPSNSYCVGRGLWTVQLGTRNRFLLLRTLLSSFSKFVWYL